MSRSSRNSGGPKPIGLGVQRVMRHLKAPKVAVVRSIFSDWSDVVGDVIGTHSRPIRIVDGTLHIEVDDQAWASEMRWMTEELIVRIAEKVGTSEITEIEVHLAR